MDRSAVAISLGLLLAGAACQGPTGPSGVLPTATPIAATAVTYDHATSQLAATTVQGALDEVAGQTTIAVPVYCGPYDNAAGGAGYANFTDAVGHCRTICGTSVGARPCSSDDVTRIRTNGKPVIDRGWVLSGTGCNALTTGSSAVDGVLWDASNATFSVQPCDKTGLLLCCR